MKIKCDKCKKEIKQKESYRHLDVVIYRYLEKGFGPTEKVVLNLEFCDACYGYGIDIDTKISII